MPRKGDRDVVWDALEEIFGPVTNAQARGRRNKVTKLVRESIFAMAELEPDRFPRDDEGVRREIRARFARFCTTWPTIRPTDTALASRWDDCRPLHLSPASSSTPVSVNEPPVAPRDVALGYLRDWKEKHGL